MLTSTGSRLLSSNSNTVYHLIPDQTSIDWGQKMSSLSLELSILSFIETRLVVNQVEISISRIQEQVCFLSCLVKIQFSVRHKLPDAQSLCSSIRSLFPRRILTCLLHFIQFLSLFDCFCMPIYYIWTMIGILATPN